MPGPPSQRPRRPDPARAAPAAPLAGLRHDPRRGAAAPDRAGPSTHRCHQYHHLRPGRHRSAAHRRSRLADRRCPMSTVLTGHLADYLRLRRALGFTLATPSRYLAQFIAYLDASDTATITVEAAMAWTRSSTGASQITLSHRLGAVRGFARYLATIDPATEVPPSGLFGKQQRHAP